MEEEGTVAIIKKQHSKPFSEILVEEEGDRLWQSTVTMSTENNQKIAVEAAQHDDHDDDRHFYTVRTSAVPSYIPMGHLSGLGHCPCCRVCSAERATRP